MINYKNFLKNIFSLQGLDATDEYAVESSEDKTIPPISPEELSPLVLAYIGDGVYELFVRTHFLAMGRMNSRTLHQNTIRFVAARSQARILKQLNDFLTEEEKQIVRRGRNKKTFHVPKSANVGEYHLSTGFEALLGYLYLKQDFERLENILANIKKIIVADKDNN